MLKNISLLFTSTFLTLVLCLFVLEEHFSTKFLNTNYPVKFDSNIGWINYPKTSRSSKDSISYNSGKTKTNWYTINSEGFRSEEVDYTKKHILVLGDSVAYGSGVNDDKHFSYYLNSFYKNYQVLNLGCAGIRNRSGLSFPETSYRKIKSENNITYNLYGK